MDGPSVPYCFFSPQAEFPPLENSLLLSCGFLRRSLLLGNGLLRLNLACRLCRRGLSAYHRRFTLMEARLLFQNDLKVRDAALVAISAAHRRGTDTLHTRAFIGDRVLHVQPVDVDVYALFLAGIVGVLNGRAQ